MITKLQIKNFKIHKSVSLELGGLNILTGQNSSGKSSIIQSLLLLRQSYMKGELQNGIQLQGDLCNIGLVDDAICEYADNNDITFIVETQSQYLDWVFAKKNNDSFQNMIPTKSGNNENVENISLFTNDFQYISASRLAPQESYPLNTSAVEIKKQMSSELGLCDLVAHYLYYYGTDKKLMVNEYLQQSSVDSIELNEQISAWESIISQGVNVLSQKEGKAFVLKYSFNKPGDFIASKEFNAINVGYGLSYALPIILALLTAKPGSLIIIENPEIHLHPHGQSELAKLIARTAQTGVQIIIETHSDHIINGILVSTKQFENGEKGVDYHEVKLFHCKKNEYTQTSEIVSIDIVGDGKIDKQPEGFFDQTDKDLSYLLGF